MRKESKRLLSLDVFRGITIAGMILVNSPGNETAYTPLDHAPWIGLTPTDLVFPFFVFIVGISLVLSLGRRLEEGQDRAALMAQVLKRTLIIFVPAARSTSDVCWRFSIVRFGLGNPLTHRCSHRAAPVQRTDLQIG